MVLPLRLLFLSAHSLFSPLAQALIVVSIRDDNFQLEFYESKDTEQKLGCSSGVCSKTKIDKLWLASVQPSMFNALICYVIK